MNNSVNEKYWFGDAPKHWEIKKISSLYKLRNEKVSDKDYPPLSVSMKGIVPQLETAAKTNDGDNRKLVRKGDFAINSRSDRRGSCGISDYDGSVSLINTVLQPRKNMHPKFYDWFFHSTRFADEFYRWGHGIVDDLWTTGWQDMKKISILYPPIEEQKKIADFLDGKCAEIDGLIADLNEEISTLEEYKRSTITEAVCKGIKSGSEMKDSGIEWVGRIPSNWNIHPLYYYFEERKNKNVLGRETNLLSLSYGNVIRKDINTNGGLLPENFNGYNIIEKDDIVLRLTDLQNDKKSLRTGLCKERGIITSAYVTLKPKKNIFSQYFRYLLHAYDLMKVLYNMGNGVRQGLNFDELKKMMLVEPPIEEQMNIVKFLDEKCVEIDTVINEKQEQISTLEQYKKSVIYEYTTGKKEVV